MAKNYKRHSQGKGFRRADIGDMGLRAYKEQQDTIINSLKLQNKQFEKTRKEFIDSDILKSAKEAENRRELKKLEDDVYDVKFENTKIRAEREIDALEHEADDLDKKSKFWLDFSTTYSKQYAEAAGTIYGAVDLKLAQDAFDKTLDDPNYLENLKNTEIFELLHDDDFNKWGELTLKEKKAFIEEKRAKIAQKSDIQRRKGHTEQMIQIEDLKEKYELIKESAFQSIKERNIEITKDNVKEIIEIRGLEVLQAENIPWDSRAGRDFMKFIRGKAIDNQILYTNRHDVQEDTENINATLSEMKALKSRKSYGRWEISFNHLMQQVGTRKVYDKKSGTFGIVELNPKQRYLAAIELLADRGIITNGYEAEKFLNIAHTDQKTIGDLIVNNPEGYKSGTLKDTRETWWTRHEKGDLESDVLLILEAKHQDKKSKGNILKAGADTSGIKFIENGLADGSIDPSNKDQIEELKNEYSSGDKYGTGKTLEKLNKLSVFSTIGVNKDGALLNANAVEDLAKDGKTAEFRELINYFPPKTKAIYQEMLNGLEFADNNGLTYSKIKSWALGELNTYQKLNDLQNIKDGDFIRLLDDTIQDVYYHINIVDGDKTFENDTKKKEWILNTVSKRIKDGVGIYSRDSDNGGVSTVWTAYNTWKGEKNIVSQQKIDEKLNDSRITTESFLKEVENGTVGTVFKQDDIDSWEKSTLKGETFITPSLVNELWFRQPKLGKDFQTRTQIFNRLLKASGATFQLPPNGEDKDQWVATQIQANIHDYFKLSLENRQALAACSELTDLGDTQMCIERIGKETVQKEKTENYNYIDRKAEWLEEYNANGTINGIKVDPSRIEKIMSQEYTHNVTIGKGRAPWYLRPWTEKSPKNTSALRLNRL